MKNKHKKSPFFAFLKSIKKPCGRDRLLLKECERKADQSYQHKHRKKRK